MSSSTQDPQDEGDDKQPLDELDEPIGGKNESGEHLSFYFVPLRPALSHDFY